MIFLFTRRSEFRSRHCVLIAGCSGGCFGATNTFFIRENQVLQARILLANMERIRYFRFTVSRSFILATGRYLFWNGIPIGGFLNNFVSCSSKHPGEHCLPIFSQLRIIAYIKTPRVGTRIAIWFLRRVTMRIVYMVTTLTEARLLLTVSGPGECCFHMIVLIQLIAAAYSFRKNVICVLIHGSFLIVRIASIVLDVSDSVTSHTVYGTSN